MIMMMIVMMMLIPMLMIDSDIDDNNLMYHPGTPLHVCAKKNLARPIRMLVDSGADVNAKHGNNDCC